MAPNALTSNEYADDFTQVEDLGRADSTSRTAAQTNQAWFWTDHDIRQWNDGMLGLAHDYHLGLVQTARMLAMAHVAGGDAMIACFDAKYHYWFWRPYQAIHLADTDDNPDTVADTSWQPLGATPNFPEYPSAHACHSTAVVEALDAFFGTDKVSLTLTSRAPHVTCGRAAMSASTTSSRTSTGPACSSVSTSATPICKAQPSDGRSDATSSTASSSQRVHGRRRQRFRVRGATSSCTGTWKGERGSDVI